tara:strand:+ start:407 stop:928 length:522 start_codon:yes stop_codon:yes gene_type:complete
MLKKLFFIFFLLTFTFNTSAEIHKIVYIDIEKIMQQSVAGKNFISLLDKKHKINISKFNKANEQIKAKEKKLITQKNILSPEDFQKELSKLRNEITNFQQDQVKARNEINKLRVLGTNKMINEITPILENYAKENSINLILQKKNIVMGKKEMEITDNIIILADKKIKKINLD